MPAPPYAFFLTVYTVIQKLDIQSIKKHNDFKKLKICYNYAMFEPLEIIFASTTACNLHCAHCFVNREPLHLNASDAKNLLASCRNTPGCQIDKVGFSGGEPFLDLAFLTDVITFAREKDFMFDQIMTNGVWWKTEEELTSTLRKIADCGYDGKIGVSYDNFHGQNYEKIRAFCRAVNDVFGEEKINIQAVADPLLNDEDTEKLEGELNALCEDFAADVFILPQTFKGTDERGWQSRKWFKDDYCEGPGQILFVHATGDIAPCCGFANENPALFIGKITDSFGTIMENASTNEMIKHCYDTGLLKLARQIEKSGEKLPGKGKTDDICTFCDYCAGR